MESSQPLIHSQSSYKTLAEILELSACLLCLGKEFHQFSIHLLILKKKKKMQKQIAGTMHQS